MPPGPTPFPSNLFFLTPPEKLSSIVLLDPASKAFVILPLFNLKILLSNVPCIKNNGDGIVDPAEVMNKFDASQHPDVIAGKKTSEEIMQDFLDTFDVGGEVDGKVTRQEFTNYYHNLSASIDNDDYFELMIRNAWHISGGEGWAANSANRRVLVTKADGTQSVEEIKDDLGLKQGDRNGAMARLRKQGLR